MTNQRKQYSPQEKVRILREHLIEKAPVSDVCDRHGLKASVLYRWQVLRYSQASAGTPADSDRIIESSPNSRPTPFGRCFLGGWNSRDGQGFPEDVAGPKTPSRTTSAEAKTRKSLGPAGFEPATNGL